MKNIALLTTALVLTFGLASVAHAEKTIVIAKSSEHVAKVSSPDKKGACMVPIKFDDGADWSTVKDAYTVSDETAAGLKTKKETISIGSDGTATFHAKKMSMKKTSMSKKM